MSLIQFLSAQPWVERLGWTLIHFLWQGTIIAAVYGAARRFAPDVGASRRYLFAFAALMLLLAAPLVTWKILDGTKPVVASNHALSRTASAPGPIGFTVPVPSASAQPSQSLDRILPSIVAAWMLGAIAFWIRLAGGWVVASQMRSMLVRPAPVEWQRKVQMLGSRIGISRPVRLLVSAIVQVPTIVGWLRPVVLVPVGALAGLPPEQVEALLVHELAHIRRHDYLVNVLQGIAEALLFYHPAVWWISNHLRSERELCCDDVAVSISGDALTYASALIELESFRPAHIPVLGANGGSLSQRIARLLGEARPSSSVAPSGQSIVAVGILLLIAAWGVFGQSELLPKFDVASIKPADNSNQGGFFVRGMRPLPNGRLTATDAPAWMLISNAYRIQRYQLIGGPSWINSDGFNIEGKGDASANQAQVLLMLRSLLEDRFQFRFHRENRDLPIYTLTIAKNGPKLTAPKDGGCVALDRNSPAPPPALGQEPPIFCGSAQITFGASGPGITGGKVPMEDFVQVLQTVLGRPVRDRTGLSEPFDISLKFALDDLTVGLPRFGPAGPATADPNGPPSIPTAIQEQLGLKLESTKGPVEVMVIDHIEKPSAN